MSLGAYIGSGDQDNYLKAAVHANGGNGGIEVVYEVAGVPVSNMYSAPGVIGSSTGRYLFAVDPNTNLVQPRYSINGAVALDAGPAIAVPGSWLQSVLAIGFTATSRNAPIAFTATWDYVTVTTDPVTAAGQWYDVPYNSAAPTARHENSFVQVGDKFYLIGGRGNKSTQAFDISDSTWTSGANPPFENSPPFRR